MVKRLFKISLLLFIILIVAVVVAIVFVPLAPIADKELREQLDIMGFPNADFQIISVDKHQMLVKDFHLGDPEFFQLSHIAFDYNPSSLLKQKIDGVTLDGLHLNAIVKGDTISFGNLNSLLLTKRPNTSHSDLSALPLDSLKIEHAKVSLSSEQGMLDASLAGTMRFDSKPPQAALAITDINMAVVNMLFPAIAALSINGQAQASLDMQFHNSKITITYGSLNTISEGAIQLVPVEGSPLAAQHDEQVQLLVDAIQQFDYQDLGITFKSDREGEMLLTMSIEGANPTLMEGQPIQLNVNFSANLFDLVKSTLGMYNLPEQIEKHYAQ